MDDGNSATEKCPICERELPPGADACPQCASGPTEPVAASELALEFYNQGLARARANERELAIDKMHGAIAADPTLVDAYIVLGKLLAQTDEAADLERAIQYWERAGKFHPTREQQRRITQCVDAADTRLRRLYNEINADRRRRRIGNVLLLVGLAAAAAVGGYMIRLLPLDRRAGLNRSEASSPASTAAGTARTAAQPPADRVEAIRAALSRPDIAVVSTGGKITLAGAVQTSAEQTLMRSAAAYAAHLPETSVDVTGLKIKASAAPVSAEQVQTMLRTFITSLSVAGHPLAGAVVEVTGQPGDSKLHVTGYSFHAEAGSAIKSIVKNVYPTASEIDCTALVVRPLAAAPTTAPRAAAAPESAPRPAVSPAVATARRSVAAHRNLAPAATSRPIETAQPSAPAPRRVVTAKVNALVASARRAPRGRLRPRLGNKRKTGDAVYIDLTPGATDTHVVHKGETISSIVRRYGKDPAQWREIVRVNQGALRNPNSLNAGTVLKLPEGWKTARKSSSDNE